MGKRRHNGGGLLCPTMGRINGGGILKKSLSIGCLGLWAVISSIRDLSKKRAEVFDKGLGFKVGEGGSVRFLYDDRVGVARVGPFLYA